MKCILIESGDLNPVRRKVISQVMRVGACVYIVTSPVRSKVANYVGQIPTICHIYTHV